MKFTLTVSGLSLGFALFVAPSTEASAITFANAAAFNAQVTADSLAFLGKEDFESSTLAPNNILAFADPLSPGVPHNPFPNGTNATMGMTVQSNTLGGNPINPSPAGSTGLATASVGYLGTPSDQVSNNNSNGSFDLIFSPGADRKSTRLNSSH